MGIFYMRELRHTKQLNEIVWTEIWGFYAPGPNWVSSTFQGLSNLNMHRSTWDGTYRWFLDPASGNCDLSDFLWGQKFEYLPNILNVSKASHHRYSFNWIIFNSDLTNLFLLLCLILAVLAATSGVTNSNSFLWLHPEFFILLGGNNYISLAQMIVIRIMLRDRFLNV